MQVATAARGRGTPLARTANPRPGVASSGNGQSTHIYFLYSTPVTGGAVDVILDDAVQTNHPDPCPLFQCCRAEPLLPVKRHPTTGQAPTARRKARRRRETRAHTVTRSHIATNLQPHNHPETIPTHQRTHTTARRPNPWPTRGSRDTPPVTCTGMGLDGCEVRLCGPCAPLRVPLCVRVSRVFPAPPGVFLRYV